MWLKQNVKFVQKRLKNRMLGLKEQKITSALGGVWLFGVQKTSEGKIILNIKKKHIKEYVKDALGFLNPTTRKVHIALINVKGKLLETIITEDIKRVGIVINIFTGGLEQLMDMLQIVKIIIVRIRATILNGHYLKA